MNIEKYKEAMEEIKPDDALIQKTIQKIEQVEYTKIPWKKKNTIFLKVANVCIIILFLVSLVWMSQNQKTANIETKISDNIPIVLEKVGTFEKLKEMLADQQAQGQMSGTTPTSNAESTKAEEDKGNTRVEYSTTNTQVNGVDEADIVKTDGQYLYSISNNTKLIITDIRNKDKITLAKEITYENFTPCELYIKNNRLIVIGIKQENMAIEYSIGNEYNRGRISTQVQALIYSIQDKQNIQEIRTIELEGRYLSSRMIGDQIYLVSNYYLNIPGILNNQEDGCKPIYKDTAVSQECREIGYNDIYVFPNTKKENYLFLTSFNITDNKEIKIQSFLGSGNNVYCSRENLYVATTIYHYDKKEEFGAMQRVTEYSTDTQIYKFALKNDNITYQAQQTVSGSVVNQFSMDEYQGYFRIATTNNNADEKETTNSLYVLNEKLEKVGEIGNIAKGEKIYSVRFEGKKTYLVTFKQVDPLFVIDLSNPTNPQILGELKISGYSTYIQPYDDTHIIGFGEETQIVTEKNGRERIITKGIKIAMFDISDVNNPKMVDSQVIGDGGTYSELLYNHKALLFSKEKNLFAFPITTRENGNQKNFQGALIYGIDSNYHFYQKGKISNNKDFYQTIKRIVYVENYFVSISDGLIATYSMDTLQQLSSLPIEIKEGIKCY